MSEASERERLRYLQLKAKATQAAASTPEAAPVEAAGPQTGFRGHGASGGWGYPDPGWPSAMGTQFLAGLTKGGADEGVAAAFAAGNRHGPGAYLRLPDGTMVAVPTREAMYRAGRDSIRQDQEAAEQHYPKSGFLAQMGGEALSDYALAGAGAASRAYQTVAGGVRGLMGSDAELTPGQVTPWEATKAGFSTLLGGAIGNQTPVVLSKVAGTRPGQYLGAKAEQAAVYGADKLKNAAGWLKVNSLHPTPVMSEAMESLPGGGAAVGRELLEQGIGGLTKKGTAKQTAQAASEAGAAIDSLVASHDAAGGAAVDVGSALSSAREVATKLMDQPPTKPVGLRLMGLIEEYQAKFSKGTATAADALAMKRALGDVAYGESGILEKTGDYVAGKYGKAVSKFERAVDESMDKSLGPGFEASNLAYRRLLGASNAAERSAARTQGNQLFSLKTLLAMGAMGGAGAAGGLPAAVAMGVGTKYGSQMGARTLYGLGSALEAPGLARFLTRGSAPTAAAARLRDLLTPEPEMSMVPVWAGEDPDNSRTLAGVR